MTKVDANKIMRQIGKRIVYWTVPAGFKDLLYARFLGTAARVTSVSSEERAMLERNRVLHNLHPGKRCFILATGPSIKRQDLKLLQGEVCIAVSNFFVHPDFSTIQPNYYCVAGYHKPITEAAWIDWLRAMESATEAATMFFSLKDRESIERIDLFSRRQVHYLHFGASWDEILKCGMDLARPIPGPQSVPVMALEIALYMGFQQIYLLGCDHDWIFHLNTSSHFYAETEHALKRAGFDEWWGGLGATFQGLANLWLQYESIQKLAIDSGIEIFNATEGGFLDVFPRVHYDSLFIKEGKG